MRETTTGSKPEKKALLMLSGGRDSLLSAAILIEQGYDLDMVTFQNGHIDGIERAAQAAGWIREQNETVACNYLEPVKIGMLLQKYLLNEWYRKSAERARLYPELQSYQVHCLSCRTAMYVHAIAYCAACGIPYLAEGARETQGFFVELPEMKERYEKLCRDNKVELLWPVFDLKSDLERKLKLESRKLSTKTYEPQCYLGCPMEKPLTAEERRDLSRYYDQELYPYLQKDIEDLIPTKKRIRTTGPKVVRSFQELHESGDQKWKDIM